MPRFLDNEEGTPCPQRVTRSSTAAAAARTESRPITAFPLAAASSDEEDEEDLDYTRALPSGDYQLTIGDLSRRNKGLRQPPRRITHFAPGNKPKEQPKEPKEQDAPPPQKVEPRREVPLPKVETRRPEPLAPAPQQDVRAGGLRQQPRRSIMPGRPMRPRISAMLKARQSNEAAAASEEPPTSTEPSAEGTRPARQSTEKERQPLDDKSQPPPNLQEEAVEKRMSVWGKQLKAPPKRPAYKPAPQPEAGKPEKENVAPAEGQGRKRSNVHEKGQSPKRKSARLSGKMGAEGKDTKKPEAGRKSGQAQPRASREGLRKRTSEVVDDEDSFVSTTSSNGELRLIKRPKYSMDSLPSPPSFTAEEEAELLPPEEFLLPGPVSKQPARRSAPKPLDPVLNEDLERCEMYEQSWLEAQESSVTQLLNYLLSQYSPAPVGKPRLALRKEFLSIYRNQPFPLIYNRVHASLLYGVLSITQSTIDRSSTARLHTKSTNPAAKLGWGTDVGLREKFLDLLMGSYEQSALITALEAVVGREMFATGDSSESERKTLERYIDRYVIHSEDLMATAAEPENTRGPARGAAAGKEDDDKGSPAWLLRRSLLRTFMLILLLDKAKARGVLGRQCLFKKSSRHKSSAAVLTALTRILLPSMGNIPKSLSHLNYTLETTQPPLAEFDYTVNNIAVDVRDGVRLARLVEVILHSRRRETFYDPKQEEEQDWPLTPHLQYPANSRVQRLHNVNLVLNALKAAQGDVFPIEAKDIVDGHRENTVGLLWSLLGDRGLELLLDWDMVKLEITKLERQTSGSRESTGPYTGPTDHVSLLKNWAAGVAAKHGLEVQNLTTSFSDGKVFAAIVDEYEQYLPSLHLPPQPTLEQKLKAIGCNSYFAGLFNTISTSSRVFSQDFVVSALSYLCSRLLQPSRPERAAMMIQRAFRRHCFRENLHRRIRLLLMAHDCAEVVNTRNRVLAAAVTIQRAYRAYLHVKIKALIDSMTRIQAVSRGFLARRRAEDAYWAATVLQRRWREVRERRFRERMGVAVKGVVGVQAMARGALVRQEVGRKEEAVLKIQKWWRHAVVGRRQREEFLRQRNAALVIQKKFRQFNGSKSERLHFMLAIESIIYLQASMRGFLVRREHNARVEAAKKIGEWYRRTKAKQQERTLYIKLRQTTLWTQERFRSITLARQTRTDYLALRKATLQLQHRFRENQRRKLAVIILQRAWRTHRWLIKLRRRIGDVITIQSLYRGHLARRNCNPRLRLIRKRLAKTVEKGVKPEETLAAKTRKALAAVKTKAGLARAVPQLETYTKAAARCAEMVAGDEAALAALAAFMDGAIQTVLKAPASAAAKNVLAATNILVALAGSAACRDVIAGRMAGKAAAKERDVFAVLVAGLQTLKTASSNTVPYDIVTGLLRALKLFVEHEEIGKRLRGRKKWAKEASAVLGEIVGMGKRRGAREDEARRELVEGLVEALGAGGLAG